MSKTIRILAILAVVQVVVAGVLFMSGNKLADATPRSQLFALDNASPDKLVIKTKEETITLLKGDGDEASWTTADDFPANQGKVNGLLDKLKTLKTSFPVATSSGAHQRFKLTDDEFERHLTLEQGGKTLGSLYLGSGAGAGRTHVRYGDDPAVYSVNIGIYDVPGELGEWLDKSVLQLKAEDLKTVTLGELTLEKADKAWAADKLPDAKVLNQQAVDEGLSPLLSLRFDTLLGKESKPEYGLDKPELTLKLEHKEGSREYQLGKLKESEYYVLKVSDRPEYFRLAAYTAKPLLDKIKLEEWLMVAEKSEPEKPTDAEKTPEPAEEKTDDNEGGS